MRGLDWQALPIISAMLGIEDIDVLIYQLVAIQEHQDKQSERARENG